jgi:hypothetical protein
MKMKGGTKMMISPLMFLPMLFYIAILVFGIYFMVTVLKRMKEKNDILKEIRDEFRNQNSKPNL